MAGLERQAALVSGAPDLPHDRPPVRLSRGAIPATTVSRWLVMPVAATVAAPTSSSTSGERRLNCRQISPASCSTQPERGKCWVNSQYEAMPEPAPVGMAQERIPVVPASMRDDEGLGIGDFIERLTRRIVYQTVPPIGLHRPRGLGSSQAAATPGPQRRAGAVCRKGERFHGDEIIGFKDAWDGVRTGRTMPLTIDVMRGSAPRGGTVLGTKRGSPFDHPSGVEEVKRTFNDLGIGALIVVGGNGSLTVANALVEEEGLPIVGVPKTIDNDVVGTDLTFGFHTAVQIATEGDRPAAHHGGEPRPGHGRRGDGTPQPGGSPLSPGSPAQGERSVDPGDPRSTSRRCASRAAPREGRYASIVVVAEGAEPIQVRSRSTSASTTRTGHVRLGGVADVIAREVGDRTGFETQVVMLGHVQQGHADGVRPCAVGALRRRCHRPRPRRHAWGQMVALRGTEIIASPLADTVKAHQAARHVPLPRRRRDLLLVGARRSADARRPTTNHCRRGLRRETSAPTPAHRLAV